MIRRNAHAAGNSWRKWDDPIVYRLDALVVWTWSIALGAWAGLATATGWPAALGALLVAGAALELGAFRRPR